MKKITGFTFLVFTIFVFFACKKESNFGVSLLPSDDTVVMLSTDTLSVRFYPFSVGNRVISGATVMQAGRYSDPVFGEVQAGFAAQFSPASVTVFTDDVVADSLVMYFPKDSVNFCYGNPDVGQSLNVYKLSERLYFDASYNNNKEPYYAELLGNISFTPSQVNKRQIIFGDDTTTFNGVSLTLPIAMASEFLNLDDSVYLSSKYFIDYFKGVYVETGYENPNAGICRFKINADFKMALYYHTPLDTAAFYFTANSTAAARLNFLKTNHTGAWFADAIDIEPAEQDTITYIQSSAVKTKINIPNLKKLSENRKIIVHRAEIILKLSEMSLIDGNLPQSEKLYLTAINDDGSSTVLADYYAVYNKNRKEYRFDIASFVSDIMNGTKPFNGFNISVYDEKNIYSRTVLKTFNNANPSKLIITYSILN